MNTKKALLIDLDNTIYHAASIGDKLFSKLYAIIASHPSFAENLELIKKAILRKPFHHVAATFQFPDDLYSKCLQHLKELRYEDNMLPFEDYAIVKNLPQQKFLVTTGFTNLQLSKIKQLKLEQDFEDIFIMDFTKSADTKKEAFQKIMSTYKFNPEDLLVIGDDPESEIKAGQDLGIDCVLYDSLNLFQDRTDLNRITNFKELNKFIPTKV